MGQPNPVAVLDKAVTILRAVAEEPATLAELVARTGLPRATAHRLAVALEGHGLVRRTVAGAWEPGPTLAELGRGGTDLAEVASWHLATLRDASGESAQFYVREGASRVCVAAAERATGLRDTVPVGARLPMTAGSAAHALLAFTPVEEVNRLLPNASFTARTLLEVRRRGWAHSVAEREPGVASLSAPVRDGAGTVLGAVSISGPVERLGRRPGPQVVGAVLDAAAAIGRAARSNWRAPPRPTRVAVMERAEVLVVGGGNGGISLAAKLLRDGFRDVTVVSPSPVHRYRPLLNYVGAGEAAVADLERPQRDVVPDGCRWIRDAVDAVDPDARTVHMRTGRTVQWSTLVLCPGMVEDWDATPGLQAAYAQGWVASTYVPGSAPQVWPRLAGLRDGSVVFTVPPEPAPCAPTALKPLFMACDHWQRTGVLQDLQVQLVLPGPSVVAVPEADELLDGILASYGVEVLRETRIERVDPELHSVSVASSVGRRVLEDVAFAHAVPHYRAPRWIAESGLAVDPAPGLVDIDPRTLRHRKYDAVWAIGDAAYLDTPSSGGALRHQVGVLAENLAAARDGGAMQEYDGYTVVPITVSRNKLLLVEIDRDGRLSPSVPFVDPIPPRRVTWLVDRYLLPSIYWRRILRGKV